MVEKGGTDGPPDLKDTPEHYELYLKHMKLIQEWPSIPCADISRSVYHTCVGSPLDKHEKYCPLTEDYQKYFELLLKAEYAFSEIDLRRFDDSKKLIRSAKDDKDRPCNLMTITGLSKGGTSIIPSDFVLVEDSSGQLHRGEIRHIDNDLVYFKIGTHLLQEGTYKVHLATSGNLLESLIESVNTVEDSVLSDVLYSERPVTCTQSAKIDLNDGINAKFLNDRLQEIKNPSQRQAINNIMEAKHRPHPYILFGPPGTGKTSTLVELVLQLYHRSTFRILVTASSNHCADKLAEDIVNLAKEQLYDGPRALAHVNSVVRLTSANNLRKRLSVPHYYEDDKFEASRYRVVVTTNSMAFKLGGQFDYVIVDEAGHASEPESLMPLSKCRRDGLAVLAGDPKQLGPVVKFRQADRLGLGKSLLVRLTQSMEVYQKSETGCYDENFITMLTESYRCDPRVLSLSSQLFYDNKLQCHNKTPEKLLKGLKVSKPNIFVDASAGQETSVVNGHSRFNIHESEICAELVLLLYRLGYRPGQVGIITPYLAQKENLLSTMKKRFRKEVSLLLRRRVTKGTKEAATEVYRRREIVQKNLICKVDTVDGFQGDEREIIIISLVRSPDSSGHVNSMRFIEDKLRFNVSLSRAKHMNIVVAHRQVFCDSNLWSKYLDQADTLSRMELKKKEKRLKYGLKYAPEAIPLKGSECKLESLVQEVEEQAVGKPSALDDGSDLEDKMVSDIIGHMRALSFKGTKEEADLSSHAIESYFITSS